MHDVGRVLTEEEDWTSETAYMAGDDTFEMPEAVETPEEEPEGPFSEIEEMELAAELLGVSSEEELDQFLGKLIRKAGQAIGKFAKSPLGGKLLGILKGAAKTALPLVGKAAGAFVGGPAGAAIGGKLAAGAGRMFGLELEGLSPEDQEYEVARRFVRFAGAATQNAATAPPNFPPGDAATGAAATAARRHAPGLLADGGARGRGCSCGAAAGGRWIRRGRQIIILGA